jgi:endonuclease YncB( thermonuclease family)
MKLLHTALLAAITLPATVAAQEGTIPREKNGYPVRVTAIVDGDTFQIDSTQWSPFPNLTWRVRVRGIDTPEKRSKCVAEKEAAIRAKNFTTTLMKRYQNRVWLQGVAHDKYGGRLDAVVVFDNGMSLGDILIKSGYARPYLAGKRQPWCVLGQYRP